MEMFYVWASHSPERWPEHYVGVTPSYAEALQWVQVALLDGWAEAWIETRAVSDGAA